MNLFFSYATLDWNVVPEALGSETYGFISRLQRNLSSRHSRNVEIFVDRFNLRDGDKWRTQLETEIGRSAVFVMLYSQAWLKSDVCWQEYLHARSLGARIAILPMLFRPFTPRLADLNPQRRSACTWLDKELQTMQSVDLKRDFLTALQNAFGAADGREDKMNTFVRPYEDTILDTIRSDGAVRPKPREPSAPVQMAVHRSFHDICGNKVPFVRVPAGTLDCSDIGRQHRVEHGFLIMERAMPATDLFAPSVTSPAAGLTFRDLTSLRERFRFLPRGLTLPSEDQWEWAMGGDPESDPDRLVPRIGDVAGTRNRWGIEVPGIGTREPVSGFSTPRREVAAMTDTLRRNPGLKWIEKGGFRREAVVRPDQPVGKCALRLILPEGLAKSEGTT